MGYGWVVWLTRKVLRFLAEIDCEIFSNKARIPSVEQKINVLHAAEKGAALPRGRWHDEDTTPDFKKADQGVEGGMGCAGRR